MAVISFKCPNCDGELIFDPETQKYKCEYCGSKFTQAELDALQPAESKEMNAGAADGSDEAEQETTEQQSADTKKKEGEDGGADVRHAYGNVGLSGIAGLPGRAVPAL